MSEPQRFEKIPLEQVDPNPWNCRLNEDAEHVRKIADSIKADGLMQLPMGRLVDGLGNGVTAEDLRGNSERMLIKGGWRVQLAFGHSRLAAFKLLQGESGSPSFDTIPIVLREFDDTEMFQHGVAENLARKDLTPIEEATAMKRYRDEFKKTSEEIGALFHLAGPTVRNKIRLLDLPEDVRVKLDGHFISEGAARALLELYDLPEEIREAGESQWNQIYKPSWIVERALSGRTAEQVSDDIDRLVRQFAVNMADSTWKHDEVFEGPYLIGACKGCQFMVRSEKQNLCLKRECYRAKEKVMERRYLEQASLLVGIEVLGGDADSSITEFRGGDNAITALKLAKSIHCPNLRLVYDPYEHFSYNENDNHFKEIGFPKAKIVCGKQQWCACMNAVKAGLQELLVEKAEAGEVAAEPEYVAVADSEDPGTTAVAPRPAGTVTFEQLKDVSRAARQQKKETVKEIEEVTIDAGKAIAFGLKDINNPKLWLEILRKINFGPAQEIEKESKGDFSDNPGAWCDEIRLAIGVAMARQTGAENYYYSEPDFEKSLKRLNEYLRKAGLQELYYGVCAETVKEG